MLPRALKRLTRPAAERAIRRGADRLGLEVVPGGSLSPATRMSELTDAVFDTPSAMPGVEFHEGRQLAFLERDLAPYTTEFRAPLEPPADEDGFYFRNGAYDTMDAEVLYAIVRHFKPRRVLELGCGFSTLVIARACAANTLEGYPVHHVAVDPAPAPSLIPRLRQAADLRLTHAEDLPWAEFQQLEANDILFVDTSHIAKPGSEVNLLVLDVLPRLAPGVVVHFHDVFLPYEYPRSFVEAGFIFTEQYLVHAFLACNPEFEALIATHYLAREAPERVAAVVASFDPDRSPGAIWLRRKPGAGAATG